MRRQNPPQTQLDRASELERYLKPLTLIGIYAAAAILYLVLIALVFIILVDSHALSVSPVVLTIFTMVAVVPASMIAFAWFLRPRDPVSLIVLRETEDLREPIELPADPRAFTTQLMDGDTLRVNLVFHYPARNHTEAVRERLYSYVQSALTMDFATSRIAPDAREIERVIDHPIESLAAEYGIEILYADVREISSVNSGSDPACFKTGTGD